MVAGFDDHSMYPRRIECVRLKNPRTPTTWAISDNSAAAAFDNGLCMLRFVYMVAN